MHRLYLSTFLALCYLTAICQLDEDFNNGDLSNWQGDIAAFTINSDGALQLMAPDAGSSLIYTELTYPDSLEWSFDLAMQFSPSTSNNISIILAADNIDLSVANGYIIDIGENGSDDALRFSKLTSGNKELLASGIGGNVASAFDYTFKISINAIQELSVSIAETNSLVFDEEFNLAFANEPNLQAMSFFGFICNYTSTRTDKFIFDNIKIEEITPDIIAPMILSAELISDTQIQLIFDEAVDMNSAFNSSNYIFNPNVDIQNIEFFNNQANAVLITSQDPFPVSTALELTVRDIADLVGNTITESVFNFFLYAKPVQSDLAINEILFDPYPSGVDFVEIINVSDKFLDIEGLIIENADKSERKIISQQILLLPGEIIALTEDPSSIKDIYQTPDTAVIIFNEIPSFNNSDGNVTLFYDDGGVEEIMIDAFDYEEDYHLDLISDTEGISLERISTSSETNDPNNWTSAAESFNFATPGYTNSVRINPSISSELVSLSHKVFSPNGDGFKDLMILNYNLPKPGFIGNVSVYDERGRKELDLAQNKLLGTSGIINWDGITENNRLGHAGIYIAYYEFFHADGDVFKGKVAFVLGKQLN